MRSWKLALWALFLPFGLLAQESQEEPEVSTTRILFILDASNSMYGRWENGTKMEVAQSLIASMLDSLAKIPNPHFQLALRVYGHQKPVPPQDCNDTKLEVSFGYSNLGRIKKVLMGLRPMGTTPIARSILRSKNDFPECPTGRCRNVILLITDGIEACEEDPCAASRLLQEEGYTLKPFVIGIGEDTDLLKTKLGCIGTFYDAGDEQTFKRSLDVILTQALDNTTAQIDLLDAQNESTVSDLPILLRNASSKLIDRSIIHTMNYLGNPDTLKVDPIISYEGTVYSIPSVQIAATEMKAGKHNRIQTDVVQGALNLKMPGLNYSQKAPIAIIRKANSTEIIHVQNFNTSVNYLVGDYEVDVLTTPRKKFKIHISSDKPEDIVLQPYGEVTVQLKYEGYGALFSIEGEQWQWVTNLDGSQTRISFSLQPGTYKVVYRPRSARQTTYSKTNTFTVAPGSSTLVRIP